MKSKFTILILFAVIIQINPIDNRTTISCQRVCLVYRFL